ncbi:hypothetical protein BSL78_14923 [Apostichopus japonicus]|uniref:Reverse transcriptase RNase H-like domain-containing protein n=1 Tax=Stichopus japonicus TaxID=307972 RepID=A0A2G8KJS3_STIJA|nr:hypothetical protein BSL78_14923 [Apostichopus japonicus]
MKKRFDQKSKERSFQTGEKVLVLLPVHGEPLRARFSGPYRVAKKISDVNYIIDTPGRRKSNRLCHINMLKSYHERGEDNVCVMSVVEDNGDETELLGKYLKVTKTNSEVLCNLDSKLGHLQRNEREDLKRLISSFPSILNDIPGKTSVLFHDVDVGDAKPIKQHPYRLNPSKLCVVRKEIEYMLENGIISPSHSPWSSPILLVPKEDGSQRLCIDYRKVNSVTVTDSHPIPRLDDCIDRIGNSKFVSKYDLLKGYWQVPLTKRAKEISTFVTPDGVWACNVMPFGMKNAPNVASPLTSLLAKKVKFLWSECCQTAFENLKLILISEPVLAAPNFKISFSMTIDASDVGVGAVLFQEDDQKVEHPVIYFSKKLNQSQRNYSTIDKEALALILSVGHFEVYLNGPYQTVVYTDHNPLVYINKFKNKSARLMRWSIFLQGYDLKIVHIPGKENICADALSRVG